MVTPVAPLPLLSNIIIRRQSMHVLIIKHRPLHAAILLYAYISDSAAFPPSRVLQLCCTLRSLYSYRETFSDINYYLMSCGGYTNSAWQKRLPCCERFSG